MGGIGILLWLLPRRVRSSWLLLAITSFGILAAVTLMAVAPILSRALAEGGLRHTLASTHPTVLNAWVLIQNRPLGPADYQKLRASTEEIASQHLGYMLRDTQRFGRTQPDLSLSLTPDEPAPSLDALLGRPFFLTEFQTHSRIVAGRWPVSPHPQGERGPAPSASSPSPLTEQFFSFPLAGEGQDGGPSGVLLPTAPSPCPSPTGGRGNLKP